MNKLADDQNAPGASQDQPALDFYARITPDVVLAAARTASRGANIAAGNIIAEETWCGVYKVNVIIGLLAMLESAERRAAEADHKAREECAEICSAKARYYASASQLISAIVSGECASDIEKTITNGNLSENRETLACGDMPPGGAS